MPPGILFVLITGCGAGRCRLDHPLHDDSDRARPATAAVGPAHKGPERMRSRDPHPSKPLVGSTVSSR